MAASPSPSSSILLYRELAIQKNPTRSGTRAKYMKDEEGALAVRMKSTLKAGLKWKPSWIYADLEKPETYNEWLKNKEESWEREHPGWKPTCGGLEGVTDPSPQTPRISGTVLAGFRDCAGLMRTGITTMTCRVMRRHQRARALVVRRVTASVEEKSHGSSYGSNGAPVAGR
jgi:hypothetical protein